jgi:ribonuclease J
MTQHQLGRYIHRRAKADRRGRHDHGVCPGFGKITGKAPVGYIYVDGTTVSEVGNVVVRDRQILAKDGMLIVMVSIDGTTGKLEADPDVVSGGFVYMRQSQDLIESTKNTVRSALTTKNGDAALQGDSQYISHKIKDVVGEYLYRETKHRLPPL